ncbi:MAG: HTTM domain-containing protein [Planctomycetaceae bacterium]
MDKLLAILRSIRRGAQTPVGPILRDALRVLLQTWMHIILPLFIAAAVYVGSFFWPVSSKRIWPMVRSRLLRFTDSEADPLLLAVFRIAIGSIGLWYAVVTYGFIEFTWYSHTPDFRETVRWIHILWGALAVLFILGLGGRLTNIAHFIVICWILNCDDIDGTVNDDLYLIASFWVMFVRLDGALSLRRFLPEKFGGGKEIVPPKAWPILLLGVNDGIFFLTAGLTKFYDPFWIRGIGLYETLSLPWIKSPSLNFVLENKSLLVTMNYVALVHELLFLPLFIYRPTRWIACLLIVGFYAQLTWPIRIDMIGPFGMTHAIALLAVTPLFISAVNRLRGRPAADRAKSIEGAEPAVAPVVQPLFGRAESEDRLRDDLRIFWQQARTAHSPVRRWGTRFTALFFAGYVTLHGIFAVLNVRFDPHYTYPPVPADSVPLTASDAPIRPAEPPISGAERWKLRFRSRVEWLNRMFFYPSLARLNDNATKILPKSLFSAPHFFGNYQFRVVVTLKDGSTREPFVVFHEDKTPGPFTSSLGMPRYFQRCMYEVSAVSISRIRAPDQPVDNPKYLRIMNNLLHFATLQLPEYEAREVAKVELLSSPMVVPNKFEGDSRPWLDYGWTPIYEHDVVSDEYHFTQIPAQYPYRLLPYYP